ncbi:MAG: hypothetical protein WCF23_04905 [Candidatus Nitrosopolaris sp.]
MTHSNVPHLDTTLSEYANKIKNPFVVSIHTAVLIVDTLPRNIAAPNTWYNLKNGF